MKKLYFANFKTSNGTTFRAPLRSHNKKSLASCIASIAAANTPLGTDSNWIVWETKNGTDYIVYAGYIRPSGARRRAAYLVGQVYF